MKLTDYEQALLAGNEGAGAKKAMQILVAIGKIFEADEMVPVASAQIAGVSYRNIGEPGLDFLKDWAQSGAKARIPAFMNPAGMDRLRWQRMGIDERFAAKQNELIDQLIHMNIEPTLTCTPYHLNYIPAYREHIAWSESSAVSYANSVLGARTNREGGPSALAAAITGCTSKFGLHLDQNRKASHHIRVNCKFTSPSEYGLLGYGVGKQIGNGIPFFEGLELPDEQWRRTEALKALGAAMAASGAVALYHIESATPEALEFKRTLISTHAVNIRIDNLDEVRMALKQSSTKLDLVAIGCPHSSLEQFTDIAHLLKNRRLKIPLWITTSAAIREQAEQTGIIGDIEASDAKVLADTCIVVAPLKELGFRHIAVDSAKAACYLPSHQEAVTYWGTTEQCIQSAIEGQWKF